MMIWRSTARTSSSLANRRLSRGRRVYLEAMEARLLMSTTTYLLNGNQLTTTVNGTATTTTVADLNNVVLTGDSTTNTFTIQNFPGHVSIDGRGGGDTINVYAGNGGTVAIHDTAPTTGNLDTLIIHAPSSVAANLVMNETTATVGTDTVTYDTTIGTISAIGQIFANGDNLTINGTKASQAIGINTASVVLGNGPTIYYSTFNALAVNATGTAGAITINGDSLPTTATLSSGTGSFSVTANSVPLTLTGGTGTTSYTINSNSGPLIANGSSGANTFTLNGSSAGITLNGGTSTNVYQISGNSGTLTINGAGTSNNVNVDGNTGGVTVNGGNGTDSFTVNSTTGAISLKGGTGSTTYAVTAPTLAPVTVVGNVSGTGALAFSGTPLLDAFTITSTSITAGTGAFVFYSVLNAVTVNSLGGNDTFLVTSSATPLTLNGNTGNSTFNIRANTARTTINTGTGISTVNIGSNAPGVINNTLTPIVGGVTVTGDGFDTVNVDDSAATTARTVTLSPTGLSGFTAGSILYSNIPTLNIKMGSGADNVNVTGTAAGTVTSLNAGTGANTFKVGSAAPALTGNMNAFSGNLTLTGSGADPLTVDDSAGAIARNASMNATTISGFGSGVLTYAGMNALAVNLGTTSNTFTVNTTNAGVPTTVNAGTSSDLIILKADASATTINAGGGSDIVAIRSTGAATTVNSTGNTSIVIGSIAPAAGGVLSGIQSLVTVNGTTGDTLMLDDTADAAGSAGAMTGTAITGLGMGTSGVVYSSIATLNINLGNGVNTFTINNTAATTVTNLTGGTGSDTVTVVDDSGVTHVVTGTGVDTVNVRKTHGVTTVDVGTEADVINVGGAMPATENVLNGIISSLTVQGAGATLNVDDGANTEAATGTLSSTQITGLSGGAITYGPVAALNLSLGSGGDTLTITGTGTVTNVHTGGGNDIVNVRATSNATSIDTGTGVNTVNVGSAAPAAAGLLAAIVADLIITGSGADTLNVTDSLDTSDTTETLSALSLTGLSTGAIKYSGLAAMNVSLGSGADTVTVTGTIAGTTILSTNGGNDRVTIQATNGAMTVNTGAGTNTVNVQATGGTLLVNSASGASDTLNVGSTAPTAGGSLAGINSAITLNGNGTDVVNVDDSGATVAGTGTLSSTAITGLSPAAINYSGAAALHINLTGLADHFTVASTAAGTVTTVNAIAGADVINVRSIASATTINAGPDESAIQVGSTMPTPGGTLAGITQSLTINGGTTAGVILDDSADTFDTVGSLTATTLTGLSAGTITYNDVNILEILGGTGDNSFEVHNTAAATTTLFSGGNGDDTLTIDDTQGVTAFGTGSGINQITVNDLHGASTIETGESGTSTIDVVDTHGGLVMQMNGDNTVNVGAIHAVTSVVSGIADSVTVNVGTHAPSTGGTLNALGSLLTITGNSATTLNLDDTGDMSAETLDLTSASINGISPDEIDYTGVGTLNINLSDEANTIMVESTLLGAATTINAGSGDDAFSVTGTLLGGSLILNAGDGVNTLTVDSSAGVTAESVTLTANTINGLGAQVTDNDFASLTMTLGQGNDTLNITSLTDEMTIGVDGGAGTNTGNMTITGDLNSDVTLTHFATGSITVSGDVDADVTLAHFTTGSILIHGDLNATVTSDGALSSATIDGAISAGAGVDVTGRISHLTLGGAETGSIQAAGYDTMQLNSLVPDANGLVWSINDGGVTRSLSALSADGSQLTGATFGIYYDSTAATPEMAIRVNETDSAGVRYDLVLSSPAGAAINLTRIDSTNDVATRVRNILISGSLLRTVSAPEAAAFGNAATVAGGIYLPNDALANVSVRDVMTANSITAKSFQGISFSRFVGLNNKSTVNYTIANGNTLIRYASAVDPKTKKTLTPVELPTEPLLVLVGEFPVELYTTMTIRSGSSLVSNGHFSSDGMIFTNNTPSMGNTLVTVNYTANVAANKLVAQSISINGENTSVTTLQQVQNLTSNGALADVNLKAGKAELLQSLSATSITGSVNLNGGTLTGMLAATNGDIGSANIASSIKVAMGANATIQSLGNIYSSVVLSGSLNGGTITAGGDIGAAVLGINGNLVVTKGVLATTGGISTKSGKVTGGTIVALGNIVGTVSISGNFGGRIAAGGSPLNGIAETGILGSVKISGSLLAGGAIISDGVAGDAGVGTSLSIGSVKGFIASTDEANVVKPKSSLLTVSTLVQSPDAGSANAEILAGIWSDRNSGDRWTVADLPVVVSAADGLALDASGNLAELV